MLNWAPLASDLASTIGQKCNYFGALNGVKIAPNLLPIDSKNWLYEGYGVGHRV
jgi:hypothetical protein